MWALRRGQAFQEPVLDARAPPVSFSPPKRAADRRPGRADVALAIRAVGFGPGLGLDPHRRRLPPFAAGYVIPCIYRSYQHGIAGV